MRTYQNIFDPLHMVISHDGNYLYVAGSFVYDLKEDKAIAVLGGNRLGSLALSADGELLYVTDPGESIMKKSIFLLLVLLMYWMASCEHNSGLNPGIEPCDPLALVDTNRTYFYYNFEEKIELRLVNSVFHAVLDSSLAESEIDSLFGSYGIDLADRFTNFPNRYLISVPQARRPEEFFTFYGQDTECGFGNQDMVMYATPVFWTFPHIPADSSITILTDEFAVKIDTTIMGFEQLRSMNDSLEVELVRPTFENIIFLLRVTRSSPYNAIDMANFYHESGRFSYATPVFLHLIERGETKLIIPSGNH